MKATEKLLTGMKDEPSKLESANQKARVNYEQAQELAKVTDEQFEAVSLALKRQTWLEWIMGHSFAFALGVVSSLVATFLWDCDRSESKYCQRIKPNLQPQQTLP